MNKPTITPELARRRLAYLRACDELKAARSSMLDEFEKAPTRARIALLYADRPTLERIAGGADD